MDAWNIYYFPLWGKLDLFSGGNSLLLVLKVTNSQNCQVDIRHHWIPCLDVATPVWLARPVASSSAQRCPLEEPDQDIRGKCWGNPQWDGTPGCVIRPVSTWGCFRVSQEYHFPLGILGRSKDSKMLNPKIP